MKRTIDYAKGSGLIPAIVQDANTRSVLMLGYMNEAAVEATKASGKVTFFSRSKQRLWTKGETSENFLEFVSMEVDCDGDTLLILARPKGPTCHLGTATCWNDENQKGILFLEELQGLIQSRKKIAESNVDSNSYVVSLFRKGIPKIAQKVGEEAVETVIEAMDHNDTLFLNESADLLFHQMVLLSAKGFSLQDVVSVLASRHKS
jgi:phosphoribosyl-AMP cyclohydrolase / phosphoribosyl-ATP pyrophosphohydrolase